MEWYNWLTLFGGSALFGAIAVDIYVKIKYSSKKVIERKKKERDDELGRLISGVVKKELEPVKQEISQVKQEITIIKSDDINVLRTANRDSLRNQLLTVFRECQFKGYRTIEDIRNFEYMFDSYKNLGGNSFMINIAEQMEHIPPQIDTKNLNCTNTKEN